jgi:hypothetical protein
MSAVRKILLLSLVLVYTLQGLVAQAVPCPHRSAMGAAAVAGDAMPAMAHQHMGHTMPEAALAAPDKTMHGDCCATQRCGASHCQASAAMPCQSFSAARPVPAPLPVSCPATFFSRSSESPFRPPISL